MKGKIHFSGIYDLRSLKFLQQEGISSFTFDLRPRSFNFIQGYRLVDLVKNIELGDCALHFSGEKNFVIKSILKSVQKVNQVPVRLEFSQWTKEEVAFYEQFNVPFSLHINDEEDLNFWSEKFVQSPLLHSIFFHDRFLQDLYERRKFHQFVSHYYSQLKKRKDQLRHILVQDWNTCLFPSVKEYMDFDAYSLSINSQVETCYRNVNLPLIRSSLKTTLNW